MQSHSVVAPTLDAVSLIIAPIVDHRDAIMGASAVARDITGRKAAEAALRASEEQLRTLMTRLPVILFALDADGVFTLSDGAGLAPLGVAPGQVVGSSYHDVHAEHPEILEYLGRALAGEEVAFLNRVADQILDARATPLRDADGRVTGVIGVSMNATERVRAEEERDRLLALSPVPMCVASFDGYLTHVNPAFSTVLGWTEEELTARPFIEFVHPDDIAATEAELDRARRGARAMPFENRYRHKDGSWCWLSWKTTVVVEDRRIYAVARDVTAHKHEQRRREIEHVVHRVLVETTSRQGLALRVLDALGQSLGCEAGIWWRVDEHGTELRYRVMWHASSCRVDTGERLSQESIVTPGHDLPGCAWQSGTTAWINDLRTIQASPRLAAVIATGIRGAIAIPVTHDGRTLGVLELFSWMLQQADPDLLYTLDLLGQQLGQFLARLRAQEMQREQAALLALAHDAVIMRDPVTSAIRFWNPAAAALYGWSADEAEGQVTHDLLATGFPGPGGREDVDAALIQEGLWQGELRHRTRDGCLLIVESRQALQRDAAGYPTGILEINRDITERKRVEETLRQQALHDALTGLPNRTLLGHRLDHALAAARRQDTSLALLLLDLDGFKDVNDSLGHDAGDVLLREVARRLQDMLRAGDTVARLAGDEFVVLLPEAGWTAAETVASKILSAVGAPYAPAQATAQVTVSIGISLFPDVGVNADALIRQADLAMYAAKRQGKNTYAVATSAARTQDIAGRSA